MKVFTTLKMSCLSALFLLMTTAVFAQQGADVAPGYEAPTQQNTSEAIGEIQFGYATADAVPFNGSSTTGATWVSADTSYWICYWQTDSVYRVSRGGHFIERFTVPVAASRSVTFDGTNVWFGNASTTITAVNPTTRALVTTVTVPEAARYLTYDATANSGAGGFWLGNWSTDVYQVSMTGTTLSTIPTANLPASRYGAAYDAIVFL